MARVGGCLLRVVLEAESPRGRREVEGLRVTGIRGCRDAGIGRATGTQDGGHADKETGQES